MTLFDTPEPDGPPRNDNADEWLAWLADRPNLSRAVDYLLDEEPADVAHELIYWAAQTYKRSREAARDRCLATEGHLTLSQGLSIPEPF